MTAVLEALDLDSWIEFSTGGEESCELAEGRCPFEAVAVAVFAILAATECCDDDLGELRVCVAHRDELAGAAAHGYLFCCLQCPALWRLLRMEPIR